MSDGGGMWAGQSSGYGYISMSAVAKKVDSIAYGNPPQWVLDFQEKWKRDKMSWAKVSDRRTR